MTRESAEHGSSMTRCTARKIKGPFMGPFIFLAECGCGTEALFDGRSGTAACPVA
jgi:hypothetical protein